MTTTTRPARVSPWWIWVPLSINLGCTGLMTAATGARVLLVLAIETGSANLLPELPFLLFGASSVLFVATIVLRRWARSPGRQHQVRLGTGAIVLLTVGWVVLIGLSVF